MVMDAESRPATANAPGVAGAAVSHSRPRRGELDPTLGFLAAMLGGEVGTSFEVAGSIESVDWEVVYAAHSSLSSVDGSLGARLLDVSGADAVGTSALCSPGAVRPKDLGPERRRTRYL